MASKSAVETLTRTCVLVLSVFVSSPAASAPTTLLPHTHTLARALRFALLPLFSFYASSHSDAIGLVDWLVASFHNNISDRQQHHTKISNIYSPSCPPSRPYSRSIGQVDWLVASFHIAYSITICWVILQAIDKTRFNVRRMPYFGTKAVGGMVGTALRLLYFLCSSRASRATNTSPRIPEAKYPPLQPINDEEEEARLGAVQAGHKLRLVIKD